MLGYHGLVKWDAYFGMYDAQRAGVLRDRAAGGRVAAPARVPAAAPPDDNGQPGGQGRRGGRCADEATVVTAFDGPDGRLTILGLDTSGGTLDGTSPTESSYDLTGLPADTTFRLHLWNARG